MKKFTEWELQEAKEHAASGGQALHLHRIIVNRDSAPKCFVRAVDAGGFIAHLLDQDEDRLVQTARSLGVKIVVVGRRGGSGQHVDLCGGPLKKALALCEKE